MKLQRAFFVALVMVAATSTSDLLHAEAHSAAERLSFARDIIPVLTKAGCNSGACHGSLQGRGGFGLSLLGYNAQSDFESLFQQARGRRVIPSGAKKSLFLLKATGQVPHGGGTRIQHDSESYRLLTEFIKQGTPRPQSNDPKIVRLTVQPESLVLAPGEQHVLKAIATWDDELDRDVTQWALFDSLDSQTAAVSAEGAVTGGRRGKSPVTVRFLGQVAAVDVVVPYEPATDINDFDPTNFIDELVVRQVSIFG